MARGCVCQGVCVAKGGICGGEGGHAWRGVCGGGGHAWHTYPSPIWSVNARAVRILLECILVWFNCAMCFNNQESQILF